MYYQQQDNLKDAPLISIPLVFVTLIHIGVVLFIKYATGQDQIGYSSGVLFPVIYLSSFFLLLTLLVGLKNKSSGLIDMILTSVVLIGTYFFAMN